MGSYFKNDHKFDISRKSLHILKLKPTTNLKSKSAKNLTFPDNCRTYESKNVAAFER